jgi:hypothetical protein
MVNFVNRLYNLFFNIISFLKAQFYKYLIYLFYVSFRYYEGLPSNPSDAFPEAPGIRISKTSVTEV